MKVLQFSTTYASGCIDLHLFVNRGIAKHGAAPPCTGVATFAATESRGDACRDGGLDLLRGAARRRTSSLG
jgi:hypothetical protein